MSTATLILFVILLLASLAYAVNFPAIALPIGIMTYSYKQIAAVGVPFLQSHDTYFNFLIAGPIAFVFFKHLTSKIKFSCHSRDGKLAIILLWIFLIFFWASSLWSPFSGFDSWKFFPYFVVYFLILPLLIDEDPEIMIRAFQLAWALTFLGALCLLLSPAFYISPDIERMVVHFHSGRFDEANPLVLADMAAYLIMMSLLIFAWPVFSTENSRMSKVLNSLMVSLGLVLGTWLAFNTSRGETVSGIACSCLFIALIKGRSIFHSILWLVGLMASLVLSAALVLFMIHPLNSIEKWSARYSVSAIAEGSDIRGDMNKRNIRAALSTPAKFVFGIGARAAEQSSGEWPHNHFVQAFSETGIIGLTLLCVCFFLSLRFGLRTIAMARNLAHPPSLIFTSFILSLLIYQLIVLSKKGSLTFVDTYMWLAIAIYSFDRTQHFLLSFINEDMSFQTVE